MARASIRAISGAASQVLLLTSLLLADAQSAQSVHVSTEPQLRSAVAQANSSGGDVTILLADGTYTLTDTLYINAPNITLTGASGTRENVVIQGDAMSDDARVGNLLRVAASHFELRHVTLQRSRWHLIQIVGESNADSPVIRDCVLRDAYQQLLKVSVDPANPAATSDDGVVENCLFEYSAGVGPQYYIGGIDAHGSKNWLVRGNTFRSIISPADTLAQFAVHFWNGSAGNVVERNLIIDCDRGIGFGLDGQGNTGGIIRNNMIYHSGAGAFADAGIAVIDSPGSQVYNNTIFQQSGYPWSIEYRFSATQNVLIANNLTNRPIARRDGASGTVGDNVENASAAWFVDVASGNLRLTHAVAGVTDAGRPVTGLSEDFDGGMRPQATGIDIGAHELGAASKPNAPMDLTVVE